MSDIAIKVENVSKQYRLGEWGTGTLSHDLNRWWHRVRGKEDPYLKIGAVNDRAAVDGEQYVWALRDINLEVRQGDVLGIIGKNGAGKSTLLKLLSRVTAPTTGMIKAKGRVASLLEVGTGFHPELTGRENIFLNGTILGMTKSEVRAKLGEIVEFAGVARYLDTPVKRYSSGMKVRLGFSVAAHLEAEILIVDEVLAVGDIEFQKKAVGKIHKISSQNERTIFFVSHNMSSIQSICTSCLLLENGEIKISGETKTIIQNYLSISRNQADIPIDERSDREGSQGLKISSIRFLHGKHKTKLNTLLSGVPTIIEFSYRCSDPEAIKNLRISIAFSLPSGDERFVCDNHYVDKKLKIKEKTGKVYCYIKKWPLNSGTYMYRFHIEDRGVLLDRLENAGKVVVEYGDFFGTGIKISPHLNGVFLDHKWTEVMKEST